MLLLSVSPALAFQETITVSLVPEPAMDLLETRWTEFILLDKLCADGELINYYDNPISIEGCELKDTEAKDIWTTSSTFYQLDLGSYNHPILGTLVVSYQESLQPIQFQESVEPRKIVFQQEAESFELTRESGEYCSGTSINSFVIEKDEIFNPERIFDADGEPLIYLISYSWVELDCFQEITQQELCLYYNQTWLDDNHYHYQCPSPDWDELVPVDELIEMCTIYNQEPCAGQTFSPRDMSANQVSPYILVEGRSVDSILTATFRVEVVDQLLNRTAEAGLVLESVEIGSTLDEDFQPGQIPNGDRVGFSEILIATDMASITSWVTYPAISNIQGHSIALFFIKSDYQSFVSQEGGIRRSYLIANDFMGLALELSSEEANSNLYFLQTDGRFDVLPFNPHL